MDLNIGVYEWSKGIKINKPNTNDLKNVIKFISSLKKLSENTNHSFFDNASESCLEINDIINQIDFRLKNLIKIQNKYLNLKNFLKDFQSFWKLIKKQTIIDMKRLKLNKKLDRKFQILSPADLCFSNKFLNILQSIFYK